ncbi:MAG: hypothetical protein ACLFWI_27060 [Coleofasciculus sp.]|uniref:hypothetical protein n=1 Tax=Coleofasciculus sp. TaxID=3100458 RepID=UPI003A34F0A1
MTTYQQALDDFGIIQLLQKLIVDTPVQLDSEERESLAAFLIEQLTLCLDQSLIVQCLQVMNSGDKMMISDRVSLALAGMAVRVFTPKSPVFPDESKAGFQIGDRVAWKPLFNNSPDWGVVMGRFYAYGRQGWQWGWQYVVWLDEASPSSVWTVADTAWEEDLQPLEVEGTQLLFSQL